MQLAIKLHERGNAADAVGSLYRDTLAVGIVAHLAATLGTQATGLPPHRFVLLRRVERAKVFLTTTPLAVAEIAWRVGWENVSRFTQAFRQSTATPPAASLPISAPSTSPRLPAARRPPSRPIR